MRFETIDLKKHRELVVKFREDSFSVSFGDASNFNREEYLNWLKEKIKDYPEGFVLVKEHDNYIGQLELSIREYEGKTIGYVHLYYLIPEFRGRGKGKIMHAYAMQFFKSHQVSEYNLRVSPTNKSALTFYRKHEMIELGPDVGGKVIRMKGYV